MNYLKPTQCHDGPLKVNAESAKARLEERRQQGVLRQRLEREKQAIFSQEILFDHLTATDLDCHSKTGFGERSP